MVAEIARLEGTSAEVVRKEAAREEATRCYSACRMVTRWEASQSAAGSVLPRAGTLRKRKLTQSPYDSEGRSNKCSFATAVVAAPFLTFRFSEIYVFLPLFFILVILDTFFG